ncbi:lactonase family protein [Paenibacillus senegalensis]|uniref:lactonase family protein n=1 Tax=Paenibacillus senegalensis TaxID=1465766 RepID=UPI000287DDD7|nr:lactonase family protein [Paenibacillus senegalensis]
MEPTISDGWHVFAGSYGSGGEERLTRLILDKSSGMLKRVAGISGIDNPSYAALNPEQTRLYVVSETAEPSCSLHAYALNEDGSFAYLNKQPTSGAIPCYVSLYSDLKLLLVANYTGGSIAAYPMLDDGRIGAMADFHDHRQLAAAGSKQQPHPHCIVMDPGKQFVFVADLGLDQIVVYKLNPERNQLVRHGGTSLEPGAGPRHLLFNKEGDRLYVINELNSTITVLAYDGQGQLEVLQSITTLPESFTGQNYCADLHLSPDGQYLYGSNRGHDSLAVYQVMPSDGRLELIEIIATGGRFPRNFALSPDGRWLLAANQESNTVTTFQIDASSGRLTPTDHSFEIVKPVFLKIVE